MRISDWSSDVCSSDPPQCRHHTAMNIERRALIDGPFGYRAAVGLAIGSVGEQPLNERQAETGDAIVGGKAQRDFAACPVIGNPAQGRSEEHTSELQSLMRNSYAVFCLKKKTHNN